MKNKHYWKKNEIIFLKECVDKNRGVLFPTSIVWGRVEKAFNKKYSYDLSVEELEEAYKRYYGGDKKCQK